MAKLTFWGANKTVTGSRFHLELDSHSFLVDCGLFQGPKAHRLKNWDPFPVPPKSVDRLFLTHAHIDHSGYIPRFCRDGFQGQIHSTKATADLCEIMLRDSAHLQEEDAYWANKKGYSKHKPALPLYTKDDAENALSQFAPLYYGENLYIDEYIRVKFRDAGHILGSSFVDIKATRGDRRRKILFTGDFGRPDRPLLQDPVQVFDIDYLVIESTYGNRLHEQTSPYEELARVINETYKKHGALIIPSFAVGRTQTLLYVIRMLEEAGEIPELPVFLDSPMAIDATDIFRKHIAELNLSARLETRRGVKLFHPRHLRITPSRDESKAINKQNGPVIIISASGMATGGRILHHLEYRMNDEKNTILFIGYQAEGTRGRHLLEGAETIKIHGKKIPVRAGIENIFGFSGHADYQEINAWLMGFNRPPEEVFIVHGEGEASEAFAQNIRDQFGWNVTVPDYGDQVELDL